MAELIGFIGFFGFILFFLVMFILSGVRIVNQYERGVVLTLGKYTTTKEPGLNFVIPVLQRMSKVDIRNISREIPAQEVITKDNINIQVGAVVYYQVLDPAKAILQVQDYHQNAISKTQAVLRDIVGTVDMNTMLQSRDEIAQKVQLLVEKDVEKWGLVISQVLIQQITLPNEMVRAMAQKAVAERNREATIIASSAELEASKNVTKAAIIMSAVPGAIRLRELQTIKDISSEQNEKIVIFMPAKTMDDNVLNASQINHLLELVDKGDLGVLSTLLPGVEPGLPA